MVSMYIRASAKDIMENSMTIAMEFQGMLPKAGMHRRTRKVMKDFIHLTEMNGSVEQATDELS